MKRAAFLLLIPFLFYACRGSVSIKEDLANGISTSGVNLSCEDVKVFIGEKESESNKYEYGDHITIKFMEILGFEAVNGRVFPGMKLSVTNSAGEVVFSNKDLYAEQKNGFPESSLNLVADLTLASPIFSGAKYDINVLIWDKKSNGEFTAKYPISVTGNDQISIRNESEMIQLDEVYLFSENDQLVITDNVLTAGDKVYVFVDGLLDDITEVDGIINVGMSIQVTDVNGNILEENGDLFSEYSESGMSVDEIGEKLSVSFMVPDASASPIHIIVGAWDKYNPVESVTISLDAEIE
ncbi:MAG: hypothetical protein ACO1O6_07535 [Bacteroidota bacterium]